MKYKPFLTWWLFHVVLSLLLVYMYDIGLFHIILSVDITYITIIILIIFYILSIQIGVHLFNACRSQSTLFDIDLSLKWSDRLPRLGLIGTVVGLIYFFSNAKLDAQNTGIILIGMGTALYTTAAGLVCQFLIDLQADTFIGCLDKLCQSDDYQI